jgi:hypothetical protein
MPRTRLAILAAVLLPAASALAQGPTAAGREEQLAALKLELERNAQQLRRYQWVQDITVTVMGDVVLRQRMACHVTPDGNVEKLLISNTTPEPKKKGAGEGGGQTSAVVRQAVAIVHQYVPLDPALLQRCQDAGKISYEIVQPGKAAKVVCRDYRLPGDAVTLAVDPSTSRLLTMEVSSYLGAPSSPVSMSARFADLPDGTQAPSTLALGYAPRRLSLEVKHSDFRPRP